MSDNDTHYKLTDELAAKDPLAMAKEELAFYTEENTYLRRQLDAEKEAKQRMVDGYCHYRNLAIRLGAKPTDMLCDFDRKLAEDGLDAGHPDEPWDNEAPDIWAKLEAAERERDEAKQKFCTVREIFVKDKPRYVHEDDLIFIVKNTVGCAQSAHDHADRLVNENVELGEKLIAVERERDELRAAICTPEVYAGVVTRELERERDELQRAWQIVAVEYDANHQPAANYELLLARLAGEPTNHGNEPVAAYIDRIERERDEATKRADGLLAELAEGTKP